MKRSLLLLTLLGMLLIGAHGDTRRAPAAMPRLPGELEVWAMAAAYPDRIEETAIRNGEWALEMDGVWYYWADGRLLPLELVPAAEEFASLRFYNNYRFGPPTMREVSPELEDRLRERSNPTGRDQRSRFNYFLDKLYGVSSWADGERVMERIEFFGIATRVHPMVVAPLARVERRLQALARENSVVAEFVSDIGALHGYNWRNIAGTNRRSYHSYGIAVDILPRSYSGGWAYWLWAAESGLQEWWSLPMEDRWQIPQPVIDAFEAEGFVWGGKWLFFDNIHFEYRPESILLARHRWAMDFPERWLRAGYDGSPQ